jgi:diguanylate cyclase (GGDEF)-like protein
MTFSYNQWLVVLSIVVAMAVSYTALRLASRVATGERSAARIWLIAGALAMGIGIWAMHFIGMLAFSLPITLAYSPSITLGSLGIAIVTSAFALALTTRAKLTGSRLAGGAVLMGAGICAMHYTGMAAISVYPAIDYDPAWVALSIAIAVTASYVALWLFFVLRHGNSLRTRLYRAAAAVVMGLAISGMHYTGMRASHFAAGSFCQGGMTINSPWMGAAIGLFALGLLCLTLVTALYDAFLQARAQAHAALALANAELAHQATHDALTGLPNRVVFMDRLGRDIARGARDGNRFAVMVLDLDRFKDINDSLGHHAGDQLLKLVAERLTATLRDVDTVARIGGDEFLLLIADAGDRHEIETVAARAATAMSHAFRIQGSDVHTSASIGVSVYPLDSTVGEELVAHADEAMYATKRSGRSGFQFFNADLSLRSRERLALEFDLRRALPLEQFELHYQPKVDIATGQIRNVEALLRWRHPMRGLVSPADFIPLAEDTGLILSIGSWVIHEACRQARQWQLAGLPFIRIAVNVSPLQFRQATLLNSIRRALSEFELGPQYLEIELTESAVMEDAEESIGILEQVSRMGVVISIDDFGTGYSSLSYLRRLPIDKLKIDRSFINELTTTSGGEAIVRAIISLAHSLNLKVVAEGVETIDQLAVLRQLRCDQYQGFLLSGALPPAELEAKILAKIRRNEETGATQTRLAVLRPK